MDSTSTMVFTGVGARPLDEVEYEAMLASFHGKYALRDRALFEFGIRTGYRIGEILSLKLGDLFENRKIRNVVTVKKSWMKGKAKSRTLPLHPRAAEAICDWIEEAGFDVSQNPEQPLFCCQLTRKRLSRHQACDILKQTARRAGLDVTRISSHTLRKSYAARMWNSPYVEKDMAKMARLLGHQNFSNTLRYLEFLDGSLQNAVLLS